MTLVLEPLADAELVLGGSEKLRDLQNLMLAPLFIYVCVYVALEALVGCGWWCKCKPASHPSPAHPPAYWAWKTRRKQLFHAVRWRAVV